jgi:hypothetical protein
MRKRKDAKSRRTERGGRSAAPLPQQVLDFQVVSRFLQPAGLPQKACVIGCIRQAPSQTPRSIGKAPQCVSVGQLLGPQLIGDDNQLGEMAFQIGAL